VEALRLKVRIGVVLLRDTCWLPFAQEHIAASNAIRVFALSLGPKKKIPLRSRLLERHCMSGHARILRIEISYSHLFSPPLAGGNIRQLADTSGNVAQRVVYSTMYGAHE
jgi:hypothetical protein